MFRRLPPLSSLRAFESAARLGSAKLAAAELSVTPAAVSHQIRHLEASLGMALFVRRPRQLVLTAQGRALCATLGEAFASMAATVDRLREPARRALTLTTTPAVASRWLVPRLALLKQHHPGLDLRIHVSHEPVPLDGVSADLAIRYGSGDWPGLVAEKLFDNEFAPVCSPVLKLRHRRGLVRYTLLHFEPPGSISAPVDWTVWQASAQVPGLEAGSGPVFSDETHTISAALAGHGVALMSLALVADELAGGSLVQPFGPTLTASPFHIVYPESRRDDGWLLAVRDWVRGMPVTLRPD